MAFAMCEKESLKSLQTENTMYRKLNFVYTKTYVNTTKQCSFI
jgi:hypothetical protein